MQSIRDTDKYLPFQGSNRVTINHLARELGLAKGTVSKALNKYPDISDATKRRVLKKAQEMDYRPLAHAQAIRTGRIRSIGIVFQAESERPFLADFLAGVSQTASEESWTLTVATSATEEEVLLTMRRLIDERKADGFILPRTKVIDPRVELLRFENIPFVLFGRTQNSTGCAWYDILGEDSMYQAVERLVELGHREIGFVNSNINFNFANLRLKGFLKALDKFGINVSDELVVDGVMNPDQGKTATKKLLLLPTPPTAIVYATDMAALGAYKAAAELGLKIGKEISIISYDGVPEGAYAIPPLTTFKVDTKRAGARLTALLIARIRGSAAEMLRETDSALLDQGQSEGLPVLSSSELACQINKVKNFQVNQTQKT